MMSAPCLLIVAGERSGDVYGAELAKALRDRWGSPEIFGCGGDAMRQAGVETVVDAHAVSMAGIVEVLAGLPRVYRAFHSLLGEVDRRKPALAVLIDFPDFNLRLAKKLKRRNIPVVYFVSPQVWAWRKGRLKQIKATVSKMICIFDFEEAIYRRAGIPVEYVGHPLVDLARPQMTREEFFAKAGLSPSLPTVALLPGSRKKEVALNVPPLLAAAARLAAKRRIQFVLPIAPTLDAGWMETTMRKYDPGQASIRTVAHATQDALEHTDIAVVASGTATLEAALHERPMVVVYRVSPLTWLVGKLLVEVPYYSIVNLLAAKPLVAELMQSRFNAQNVCSQVEYLLDHPEARVNMARELRALRARLGPGGAIARAGDAVVNVYNSRGATIPHC
jgi:lipid-A-disaccharide synthase